MTKRNISTEKLTEKWKARELAPFKVLRVEAVNFKPHPFMIGARHVAHASDHCGGLLGEETMRAIPCAWPGCRTPWDEHTHDTVLMLQLTRDATNDEAQAALKPICMEVEADGIDGFTFVETPEKYRIAKPVAA